MASVPTYRRAILPASDRRCSLPIGIKCTSPLESPASIRYGVSQLSPNLGEKREESSGRQGTNRSAATACTSRGWNQKSSAINQLEKGLSQSSNPCLTATPALRAWAVRWASGTQRLACGSSLAGSNPCLSRRCANVAGSAGLQARADSPERLVGSGLESLPVASLRSLP